MERIAGVGVNLGRLDIWEDTQFEIDDMLRDLLEDEIRKRMDDGEYEGVDGKDRGI